jgi:hypothetical protein
MYVARWRFTARFGQKDACLGLLRKWTVDVAYRIGWRPSSLRVLAGGIGVVDTEVELEVKLDSLSDLEAAWADMARVPYQAEYQKQLADLIVPGSDRWTVHRVVELGPEAD